jgi:hypothetical protein
MIKIIRDTGLYPQSSLSEGGVMNIQSLLDEVEILKQEYEKFERGNKSAGTRARKSLQSIKKIAQDLRVQIQDAKKPEGEE